MATYEDMDLICQTMVAFGQGAGSMRVSHTACRALLEQYQPLLKSTSIKDNWEQDAVQVLERIRAVGRLAASNATNAGRTVVVDTDVNSATSSVSKASETTYC